MNSENVSDRGVQPVLVGGPSRIGLLFVAAVTALTMMLTLSAPGTAGAWLSLGAKTRYPAEGGTWQYGFWDAKVRSYYTVNRCHGSSVRYNGTLVRSIDTASGKKSIAEQWAINTSGASDQYYYRTC